MKRLFTLACLLLVFSNPSYSYEVGDTIDEEVAKLLNLPEGKPAVLDFFASWCLSCAKEIPDLQKFISEDAKGQIAVIGVDVDEELEDGLRFQKKLNIHFPVFNDTEQTVIEAFGPIGMPALYYVIDGILVGKKIGAIHHIDQQIIKDLEELGVEL